MLDKDVLTQLVDRHLISDCLIRYARGVDRLDVGLIHSAFWEDAVNTHGPISGTIEQFAKAWLPTQRPSDVYFHLISNQTIEIRGDLANCEAYFIAAVKNSDKELTELLGGRYIDEFQKRKDEWRIQARLVVIDWQGQMDGSGMAERISRRHHGARDKTDPSYDRPLIRRAANPAGW